MDFGIPNLRKAKKEKYEHLGVITFESTGPGLARRMCFNTKAKELLKVDNKEITNQVAFSFATDGSKSVFIANVNNLTGRSEIKLNKEGNILNKKYYEYIKGLFGKDETEEVEFFLKETSNEFNNVKVFELVLEQPEEEIMNVDLDTIPEVHYDENDVQDENIFSPEPESNDDSTENFEL